jgi:hypothetical protein
MTPYNTAHPHPSHSLFFFRKYKSADLIDLGINVTSIFYVMLHIKFSDLLFDLNCNYRLQLRLLELRHYSLLLNEISLDYTEVNGVQLSL